MAAHVPNRISTLNLQRQNYCSLSIAHATLQQWRLFTVTVSQNSTLFYPDYSAQFLDSMNESKKSSWTQQTESLRFV